MRSICVLSGLAGCGAATIPAVAPSGGLVVDHVAGGWATVREPGWFHADFPGPPRVSLEADQTHQGHYRYKQVVAQAGGAMLSVHYVEYGDPRDLEEARTTLHERLSHPVQQGIHVVATSPVTLGSATGDQMQARVDPSSETNAATVPLDERVLLVFQQHRLYQIQCAAPTETFATCERFLASFQVEAAPG
jgi:hypothetical protein